MLTRWLWRPSSAQRHDMEEHIVTITINDLPEDENTFGEVLKSVIGGYTSGYYNFS